MTEDGLAGKCIKKDLSDSQCEEDQDCRPYGDHAACQPEVGERETERDRETERE